MKKTVLITGASRGIGRETALNFFDTNYNVVINYKKEKKLAKEVVDILRNRGINAMCIQADISNIHDVKNMFDEIHSNFGLVDILINNAGIASIRFAQDVSFEEWNEIFGTNVNGMFYCTKLSLQDMLYKKSGCIVNLTSIWGEIGAALESHYAATKGAVISYTKSLAKELGPSNIRVNAVAPGGVDTDMLKDVPKQAIRTYCEEVPMRRLANPKEVSDLIHFLISDNSSFITGQIIGINGGFY